MAIYIIEGKRIEADSLEEAVRLAHAGAPFAAATFPFTPKNKSCGTNPFSVGAGAKPSSSSAGTNPFSVGAGAKPSSGSAGTNPFSAGTSTSTFVENPFGTTTGAKHIFVIGGKVVEASNLQDALAQVREKPVEAIVGRRPPKSVSELDKVSAQYYRILSLCLHSPGQLNHMCNKHFRDFDGDKNGKIDLEEFKKLVAHIAGRLDLPCPDLELAAALFSRYDGNESGFIEADEFERLYHRLLTRMLASFKASEAKDLHVRASVLEFRKQYELGKKISSGAQGVTYFGTEKSTGRKVVVKKPNDATDLEDFEQLQEKTHPHVVKVFALFHSQFETFVVMELCSGGDLFGVVKECRERFGSVSVRFCASAIQQVLKGIEYIHCQFKECHNDIKPENVLADHKPEHRLDVPRFMVADFGCASATEAEGCTGDPRYNAPELWRGGRVSFKSDVWAVGVMLYELLSGGLLIFTNHANVSGWGAWTRVMGGELFRRLQQRIQVPGAQPDWTKMEGGGPAAVRLCQRLLVWDPYQRSRVDEALRGTWFQICEVGNVEGEASLPESVTSGLAARHNHSQMKMMLLNMVTSRLQGESLRNYQLLWEECDKDGDGVLSKDEFVNMMVEQGMSRHVAEDLHAMADLSSDGQIDFNEFVAVMFNEDGLEPEVLEGILKSVFMEIAGSDGRITVDELIEAFPSAAVNKKVVEELFGEIDTNGDGYVTLAEFNEFVSLL